MVKHFDTETSNHDLLCLRVRPFNTELFYYLLVEL